MSLSNLGAPTNDKKLGIAHRATTLNPNAAEFIPSALRLSSGSTSTSHVPTSLGASTTVTGTGTLGKKVLDRSGSSLSNNSDEEAHQYWRHQLPDDITPDFNIKGEDESDGINSIHFSTLYLHDGNEISKFSASTGSVSHGSNGSSIAEKMAFSVSSSGEDTSSASFLLHLPTKPWGKSIRNNDQLLTTVRDGPNYNGNPRQGLPNERAVAENMEMNPLEFLALQFPGFATASLAEVYIANGGDLNLAIEMLNQLELHVDSSGLDQNLNLKALSAPNLSTLGFAALSVQDGQNGLPKNDGADIQQTFSPHRSTSQDSMLMFKSNSFIPTRGSVDFASAVRKMSSQDLDTRKYDRNGSGDASVGSSRSAHVFASSYKGGQGRAIYGDPLQSQSSSRAAPICLETGEAVANLYSEMRDEARDHARLRNACFEQAWQAYLIGNKALAKELSVKGQLPSIHMKAAHGKAQESIYRQRNPISPPEMQLRSGRAQEKMINLHGLHVSEAIHMLKRELGLLRSAATSRLQVVYICVGTGHHTRGSRTSARLPIAVQRYLLEEEGLDYSEPQPGLLRVVIC